MTFSKGSPGFQEGGEVEVGLGLLLGLGVVGEEEVGRGNHHCCLGEEEGSLETAVAGHLAAIWVWS